MEHKKLATEIPLKIEKPRLRHW